MTEYNLEIILPFLVFIIPGFISFKIWSLLIPTENKKTSDHLFDVMCYSALNFALSFWIIDLFYQSGTKSLGNTLLLILTFILFPTLWPVILRWILSSDFLKGKIIHPTPKAWDHFFSLGESCFVLIHLKNGNLIGGLYANNAFASSYPHTEDLYLSEVWETDNKGKFITKVKDSKGLLISKDYIDYIELFET